MVLRYDPVPWLLAQEGLPAVRARRALGLAREGDAVAVAAVARMLADEQLPDGSFAGSPMRTAGVLCLLADLRVPGAGGVATAAAEHLVSVLASQPGCGRAGELRPGGLRAPCDLCGFFGPYDRRGRPEVVAWGASEMNHYRDYEPLLGPKSPVRSARRSSFDRAGPGSCYAWGLVPLAYLIEALCRAGRSDDPRLQPAVHALLGAQRDSGGWCRNLGGHPACTLHAMRTLGAHPQLRSSVYAERAAGFLQRSRPQSRPFAVLHAVAGIGTRAAREVARTALEAALPRQRKDGAFGGPCHVERVRAVLTAVRALGGAACCTMP